MPRGPQLSRTRLSSLIDDVYAAAQNPSAWEALLLSLTEALAASGTIFLHHDLTRQGGVPVGVRIDPDALRLYNEHYHQLDPWAEGARTLALSQPGRALSDEMLVPRSHLYRTEYFNDFIGKFGLTRILTVNLNADPAAWSGITVIRGQADPAFGESERRFVQLLTPHLRRAFDIHGELQAARQERDASQVGLDAVSCGVLLLRADARIVFANRAARTILALRSGLREDRNSLAAESVEDTRRLREICAAVARGREAAVAHAGGALAIARAASTVPLQVLIAPSRTAAPLGHAHSHVAAIVFVHDPLLQVWPSQAALSVYYALTPVEAQIAAALATGATVEEVARERGYTKQTVRWYSKQILQKTGCRHRGELVRQLSQTLAALKIDTSPSSTTTERR